MFASRSSPAGWASRVVLCVAALVIAGVGCSDSDSSDAARPTQEPPTATTSAPSGSQIQPGIPQPLTAGEQQSPEGFVPLLRFRVPAGWFGGGDAAAFGVGRGLDTVNERFRDVGLQVETLDLRLADAVSTFATVAGLETGPAVARTFAGRPAKEFHARVSGGSVGLEALGTGADVNEHSDAQIFVDLASGQTMLIRTEVVAATARPELLAVLESIQLVG